MSFGVLDRPGLGLTGVCVGSLNNLSFPLTGDCWYHIPSPPKQKLTQVSVGQTSVYALDENGKSFERLHGQWGGWGPRRAPL